MVAHFAGLTFTDAAGAPFSHDMGLMLLSYAIAAIGSYTALDMSERLRGASGASATLWLVGSATTLGGSIWAMHFVGLLALRIAVPIGYDPVATILSLIIAIGVVALGLHIARAGPLSAKRLLFAGSVVGLGIATMHYVGMAALIFPGTIAYHIGLFSLSVLIALVAAIVSLWLSMTLVAMWHRVAAALVMAAAICGMHYTGMAGTQFLVDARVVVPEGVAAGPLAAAVTGITLTLLALAVVTVAADRRLYAASRHEAEALRDANAELENAQREIVRRLSLAVESRDSDTGEHVDRIGLMAQRLALKLGCEPDFADALLVAAPLHDIGKIGIVDTVLLKAGKLSPGEWADMQKHAEIGHKILKGTGIELLDLAAEIARHHHEKWDGSGYPNGLVGEAIPLASRIVAVVDVFDALLSRRPYKEPWPLDQVVAHIRGESGKHFDPRLVEAFLADLTEMVALRARHAGPAPSPSGR